MTIETTLLQTLVTPVNREQCPPLLPTNLKQQRFHTLTHTPILLGLQSMYIKQDFHPPTVSVEALFSMALLPILVLYKQKKNYFLA